MSREPSDPLAANRRYAASFTSSGLPATPARAIAVLTCMDARIDPQALLGLELGDAHVLRNAGGRASDDALRSLIVSTQLLGTRRLLVIHHTRCGMLGLESEELSAQLRREAAADASGIDFLGFVDLRQSVRDDVRRIRDCPLLPGAIEVRGFVYDVDSGALTPVDDAG